MVPVDWYPAAWLYVDGSTWVVSAEYAEGFEWVCESVCTSVG